MLWRAQLRCINWGIQEFVEEDELNFGSVVEPIVQ